MQESHCFLVRVQCRRKESSRSLSHLLMSFLLLFKNSTQNYVRATRVDRVLGTALFWEHESCRSLNRTTIIIALDTYILGDAMWKFRRTQSHRERTPDRKTIVAVPASDSLFNQLHYFSCLTGTVLRRIGPWSTKKNYESIFADKTVRWQDYYIHLYSPARQQYKQA